MKFLSSAKSVVMIEFEKWYKTQTFNEEKVSRDHALLGFLLEKRLIEEVKLASFIFTHREDLL